MQVLEHFFLDLWQHSVPLTEWIASSLFHAGGGQCDQQGLAEAGDLFHIIKTTLYEHRRWRSLLFFSCKFAQQIEAENFSQVRTTMNTSLWLLFCSKGLITLPQKLYTLSTGVLIGSTLQLPFDMVIMDHLMVIHNHMPFYHNAFFKISRLREVEERSLLIGKGPGPF